MGELARFREKLFAQEICLGTWVTFTDPTVTEVLCGAGYDFLVLDMEHAPLTLETVQLHLLALRPGTMGVVRVPWNDQVYLKQVLDLGAEAVMVPMVKSREEAEKAVASCFYPPLGIRGFGPRRASRYDRLGEDYIAKAETETLVVLQIEHGEAVRRIDEILSVVGVGMIFIGPWDLSGSLGVLGKTIHPHVLSCVDTVIERAQERKIPVGIAASSSEEEIWQWVRRGIRCITVSTDYGFLARSTDHAVRRIREKLLDERGK